MHATEEYELCRTLIGRGLREFKRITSDIGKADDFIALVMMTKYQGAIT
jgi:hypothetical protein